MFVVFIEIEGVISDGGEEFFQVRWELVLDFVGFYRVGVESSVI